MSQIETSTTEFSDLPREIHEKIFSFLDHSSLCKASLACKSWMDMIHYSCWKTISNFVTMDKSSLGPRYMLSDVVKIPGQKRKCWIEKEHSWTNCQCILLSFVNPSDFEFLDSKSDTIFRSLCEVESACRLAVAGIITSVKSISIENVDLNNVPISYLRIFMNIAEKRVCLKNVNGWQRLLLDQLNSENLRVDNAILDFNEGVSKS